MINLEKMFEYIFEFPRLQLEFFPNNLFLIYYLSKFKIMNKYFFRLNINKENIVQNFDKLQTR